MTGVQTCALPIYSKVTLKNYQLAAQNPTGIPYTKLRVFFEIDNLGSVPGNTTVFGNIKPTSPYVDLNLTSTDGDLNLDTNRIGGLENNVSYGFKVAAVDNAGNVGYFTDSNADTYCDGMTNTSDCHRATPGEVVGVLDGNKCFIATAAFGSALAPQVRLLREFRDRFLLTSTAGKVFVRLYYRYSPRIAAMIEQNPTLKVMVRGLLLPIIGIAWMTTSFGPAGFAISLCALLAVSVVTAALALRFRRRRARA